MLNKVMLACGDAAMSFHANPHDQFTERHPSCVIHSCCVVIDTPNLENRLARCYHFGQKPYKNECIYKDYSNPCKCEKPSAIDLPFFEFKGEGSLSSRERCKNCNFIDAVHLKKKNFLGEPKHCGNFEAHGPYEFDTFYCGCYSWD